MKKSAIEDDLYRSRNVRQYGDKGFVAFGAHRQRMALVTRRASARPQEGRARRRGRRWRSTAPPRSYPEPDNSYIFDKLNSVFLSGNATRDDAPNHIRIQKKVPREVAQTWVSMCPAQVYEIPEEQLESGAETVDVQVDRLQLRPVRRDHRQGRPPDPPRGRRRAALHGDVASAQRYGPGPDAATKAATSCASCAADQVLRHRAGARP